MQPAALPDHAGTYVLIFRFAEPLALAVGRLGPIALEPGTYAYVGSAAGPGGLRARVARHLRRGKPLRWHIDYLTETRRADQVLFVASDARLECATVHGLLARPGATVAVAGFGSSDCRAGCRGHLIRLPGDPAGLLSTLGPEWSLADDA